jgi:Ca2+-binding EF-hand superfamily protein
MNILANTLNYLSLPITTYHYLSLPILYPRTLARNLRYALGADELADRVLQGPLAAHVTWAALLALAGLPPQAGAGAGAEPSANKPPLQQQQQQQQQVVAAPRGRAQDPASDASARVPLASGATAGADKGSSWGAQPSRQPQQGQRHEADYSSDIDDQGSSGGHSRSHSRSRDSPSPSPSPPAPASDPVEVAIRMFKRIDRDGDGSVTHIELIKALRGDRTVAAALQLPSHIRQEDGTRDSYMLCFNEIDRDGTGTISLDEFLQFLGSCREKEREREREERDRAYERERGRGGDSRGGDSPAAPAHVPTRLQDPEDRRAGSSSSSSSSRYLPLPCPVWHDTGMIQLYLYNLFLFINVFIILLLAS